MSKTIVTTRENIQALVLAVRAVQERNPLPILREVFNGRWIWEVMASITAGNLERAITRAANHCYVSAVCINLFSLEEGTISDLERARRFAAPVDIKLSKVHERLIRRQAKLFNLSETEVELFRKANYMLFEIMQQEVIEVEICLSELPHIDLGPILYWDVNQHQEKLSELEERTLNRGLINIPAIEHELLDFGNRLFAMQYLLEVQKVIAKVYPSPKTLL